ncbi:MAG: MucB/RseB C-terminal domain-containing protein [Zhongshania sp.]|uniref:MucB/RseB C-terminal domain-containing protein n=1 Tax=Zhongshania sp. TaxID=1971902 RepID=UPI00261B3668|nr:MucB/RseB C-terminal domain-containing protein [Zhongshania sp.]MDF1690976.1 MucB/RseB C-terminal domain-containing protein [Zhongshania sp.]
MRLRLAVVAMSLMFGSAYALSLESEAESQESNAEVGSDLLNQMTHSHRELNYRAIVSYQVGDQLNSYRITHTVRDGKEFESLESLDGSHQDLVYHGHDINCVHPGPQLIRLFSGEEEQGFYRYYDLDVKGAARVAGREAVTLMIRPRDVYRLGYKLSLDKETGLLLRSDIVNQQGKVLERFQYVMLDLNIPADEPVVADAREVQHRDMKSDGAAIQALARRWRPNWIPAGFTLAQSENNDEAAMTYTDGLAVMSVFVEPLVNTEAGQTVIAEGGMRRGASVSYTVAFPDQGRFATVVGEVPMLTAKQVAKSLTWTVQ